MSNVVLNDLSFIFINGTVHISPLAPPRLRMSQDSKTSNSPTNNKRKESKILNLYNYTVTNFK